MTTTTRPADSSTRTRREPGLNRPGRAACEPPGPPADLVHFSHPPPRSRVSPRRSAYRVRIDGAYPGGTAAVPQPVSRPCPAPIRRTRRCASRSQICSGRPARSVTWMFPRASPTSATARRACPTTSPSVSRARSSASVRAWSCVAPCTLRGEPLCSRCLQPVEGTIDVHVDELFETAPLAGETYQLDDDALDLLPLVRDVLLLELPTAPLCRDDCAGICPECGADRNVDRVRVPARRIRSPLGGPAVARTLNSRSLEWPSRSAR